MEIVEHLPSIGYVLFHHRNDSDQHLFSVREQCKVIGKEELDGLYANVNTTEMYVAVTLGEELDATLVKCSKKAFTQYTRYDAQYASIESLQE